MPFPESLKVKIRKRAQFRCCICKSFGVEIHHIVPQAEGGADTEDNAAPLCPSCHGAHGANPQRRKQIREARDAWYERCMNSLVTNTGLEEISDRLQNLATKEDIERLAIRNTNYILGSSEGDTQSSLEHSRFSFTREEFIHPLIIRELLGWISDSTETICSVDIASSNRSNRFYGEFVTADRDGKSWIKWKGSNGEFFMYSHISTSPSGVEMVECYDCGGGSGVFGSVGLFCLECDRALEEGIGRNMFTRERVILKSLGSIRLGDRYDGEIKYEDGFLVVGPDHGWFNRGQDSVRKLPIR